MTDQPASQRPTITLPPQSANGTSPQFPAAPSPPKAVRMPMHTRISGLRTSLIAAAGTDRIVQLRRIMRRDRRKPPVS
jgi:hypothetical protein